MQADGRGLASRVVTTPKLPTLRGKSLFTQVFTIDPGVNWLGGTTSNAVELQFGGR